MSSSSSVDVSSSLQALDESRGSSVSTELREEYEDLLRYAVVVPVLDAKKMAGGGGGGGPSSSAATMVSRTTMVSSASQQLPDDVYKATRTPQPPLNPEGK